MPLPATSFARRGFPTPRLPSQVWEGAADSGGFVAMRKGRYTFSIGTYMEWLLRWRPAWAVPPDFPCLDASPEEVRRRQHQGTALAEFVWTTYAWCSWGWCPVIQGRSLDHYRKHARDLAFLIRELQHAYATDTKDGDVDEGMSHPTFRGGIGSLKVQPSRRQVHAVVQEAQAALPDVPLHLFGMGLRLLHGRVGLPEAVVSLDSAAWNGRIGRGMTEARASGITQRDFAYREAAPSYLSRMEQALASPKHAILL